jgi:hypothetical protein
MDGPSKKNGRGLADFLDAYHVWPPGTDFSDPAVAYLTGFALSLCVGRVRRRRAADFADGLRVAQSTGPLSLAWADAQVDEPEEASGMRDDINNERAERAAKAKIMRSRRSGNNPASFAGLFPDAAGG